MQKGFYTERLGRAFKMIDPPVLQVRTPAGCDLSVSDLRCSQADFGLTGPLPSDDAYLVGLHLVGVQRQEMWLDSQLVQAGPVSRGDICFYDLRRDPLAFFGDPFHMLAFYISRAALAEVSEELGQKLVADFSYDVSRHANDPVVAGLGQLLLPLLAGGGTGNQLYVDHVLLALRSHLAVTYGGLKPVGAVHRGGLAPWQCKRALEMLREHLAEGIRLDALSQACNLSSSAFLRSFKKTVGLAPHQWLMERRVERARELIHEGAMSLSEVALCAGFSDQSHLTRVFSQQMGVSPGAWRRALSTHSTDRDSAALRSSAGSRLQLQASL